MCIEAFNLIFLTSHLLYFTDVINRVPTPFYDYLSFFLIFGFWELGRLYLRL